MGITTLALIICGIALVAASINDIKTREVPDWLNFGLIGTGFAIHFIYSAIYSNWWILLYGTAGFLIAMGLGYGMYYTGQWGGGDSKMIMGLGAMLGIDFMHYQTLLLDSFFVGFIINLAVVGAFYGLIWSIIMAIYKWKPFSKEFRKTIKTKKFIKIRRLAIFAILLMMILVLLMPDNTLKIMFLSLMLIGLMTLYMWPFVKSVENVCMYKMITPDLLTEGDWIAKDIHIAGELICGPKDLGIEKEQIKKLITLHKKGKIEKIMIKEGIPFIPSFLLAFIISIVWGNMLRLLLFSLY